MATFSGWEAQTLEAIGAPVTVANVYFLDAWQAQEGGSAANNPLNTTWDMSSAGATPYNTLGGGGHVWNYADPSQGVDATAKTLQGGYYPAIVAALKSGNPFQGDLSAIASEMNTWGTGSSWLSKAASSAIGSLSIPSNLKGFTLTPDAPSSGSLTDKYNQQTFDGSNTANGSSTKTTSQSDAMTIWDQFQVWAGNTLTVFFLGSLALALIAGGIAWLATSNPTVQKSAETAAKAATA